MVKPRKKATERYRLGAPSTLYPKKMHRITKCQATAITLAARQAVRGLVMGMWEKNIYK